MLITSSDGFNPNLRYDAFALINHPESSHPIPVLVEARGFQY
ncbi:MAG: hypothetical protein ACFFEN_05760 [Candidatus Thorarchaeota archaeon]